MPSSVVELSEPDRVILESWTRSSTVSAGRVERARIVLAVADGAGTTAVARRLGISRPTVIKWRDRFAAVPFEDNGGSRPLRYYQELARVHFGLMRLAEETGIPREALIEALELRMNQLRPGRKALNRG